MSDLFINPRLTIAGGELEVTASRSGGPGGQNVNKVASKVTLRWSPDACPHLDPGWRQRLKSRHANRINREGQIVLHSQRYRDQLRNLADVRGKLTAMLLECEIPAKSRKPTRPTRGSQRRRLDTKKQASQKKALRKRPRWEE